MDVIGYAKVRVYFPETPDRLKPKQPESFLGEREGNKVYFMRGDLIVEAEAAQDLPNRIPVIVSWREKDEFAVRNNYATLQVREEVERDLNTIDDLLNGEIRELAKKGKLNFFEYMKDDYSGEYLVTFSKYSTLNTNTLRELVEYFLEAGLPHAENQTL